MRPVLTGWFAEFAERDHTALDVTTHLVQPDVTYRPGAAAFAGATYDPTSHYRAAVVFDFHRVHGLTPPLLRATSQRQVGMLKRGFERLDIDPRTAHVEPMPDERRGGFLALRTSRADELARSLKARGIATDARGEVLRLGPAPYVRDDQLQAAIEALGAMLGRPHT